jgi:hypothetical protein
VLFSALLALGAFAAAGASGAQAAPELHCSVEPCRFRLNPDGEGKTAHHVWVIDDKSTGAALSFTCAGLDGEGTSTTRTSQEITFTNLNYNRTPCTVDGSTGITFNMMGCGFAFTAAGQMSIRCPEPAVNRIRVEKPGCTYEVGEQGPLGGITYHNLGVSPSREITVSNNVTGIVLTMTGTSTGCLLNPADSFEVTYITGNTIWTAETQSEVRADGWWL